MPPQPAVRKLFVGCYYRFLVHPFRTLIVFATFAFNLKGGASHDAWLRYSPMEEPARTQYRKFLPAVVIADGSAPVVTNAQKELVRGIRDMTGCTPPVSKGPAKEDAIVVGTLDSLRKSYAGGIAGKT